MNILFCHDGPINHDTEKGYYSIGFNDKLFSRYEAVFGKVSFITRVNRQSDGKYRESDKLSDERFRIVEYPNYLNLRGIFSNRSESDELLVGEVRACDALIIRLPSFLGSKCVKLAKKYGKPYLVELVGCPWDSLRTHGVAGKILAPYMKSITKRQVLDAPFVLYVTEEFLQSRYPTNGRQVGCSDVELQSDKTAKEARTHGDRLVLGTAGKIDLKYKGHSTVIEAMKALVAQGYDVYYQVAGPGDKAYIENIAKKNGVADRVECIGVLSHNEIFSWLDTIDVYVQPSLTEGMPRALIEAMSRGCPCVASNAGGMPELIDKEYIFEAKNEKALAHILANSENNGLWAQGKKNAEFAKRFYPDSINEKREAFYNEFFDYVKRKK